MSKEKKDQVISELFIRNTSNDYFGETKNIDLNAWKKILVDSDISYYNYSELKSINFSIIEAKEKVVIYSCKCLISIKLDILKTKNLVIEYNENLKKVNIDKGLVDYIFINNCQNLNSINIGGNIRVGEIKDCDNLQFIQLNYISTNKLKISNCRNLNYIVISNPLLFKISNILIEDNNYHNINLIEVNLQKSSKLDYLRTHSKVFKIIKE